LGVVFLAGALRGACADPAGEQGSAAAAAPSGAVTSSSVTSSSAPSSVGAQAVAAPADSDSSTEPPSLPQDGLFSSIKQSIRAGDEDVVRGHFEVGSAPNVHRYYCLVDPKTGRREPNGVLGELIPRKDGMTGIKSSAVSLYVCAKAEQRGLLVTQGYVVKIDGGRGNHSDPAAPAAAVPAVVPSAVAAGSPAVAVSPSLPPAVGSPAGPVTPSPVPVPAGATPSTSASSEKIDVAGVALGMSPDDVRRVLKSKQLLHYREWSETLSYWDAAKGAVQPIAGGRFVNVISTWTAPPASVGADRFTGDGESFEVMFTPVPGGERVLAIVHSQGYSLADAIHETTLDSGLAKKYGGFGMGSDLPEAVTWRYQSDGSVQIGDACGRRGTFGGVGGLAMSNAPPQNLALKSTPEELQAQIERCGVTILTEDHITANGGSLAVERLVTRFTVTAYSPWIALDGAKSAARLIEAAGHAVEKGDAAHAKDKTAPDL
jgi:hypothetical protein